MDFIGIGVFQNADSWLRINTNDLICVFNNSDRESFFLITVMQLITFVLSYIVFPGQKPSNVRNDYLLCPAPKLYEVGQ